MLRKMRSNLKSLSWTLWLVILAFIGFIFVEWGSGRLDSFGSKSDLLSVNGKSIRGEVFQKNLTQSLNMYKDQFKNNFNISFVNQLRIPEQILQNLINKSIIQQEAEKLNILATEDEVKDKIINYSETFNDKNNKPSRVFIFRENGKADGQFIGVKEYERRLAYSRIEINEFEQNRKNEIVFDKFKELITGGMVINKASLWELYKKEKDKAEVDFIVLKPDRIKNTINPSPDNLKSFYEKNKNQFKSPEKRAGYVIAYKYDDFKKDIKISNQELYDYFKKHKKMFMVQGKTKVSRLFLKYSDQNREDILKKAETILPNLKRENFSEKTKELSQDDKAQVGGDWGYWEWKNFTKQELSIIENMKENQISSPIDTLEGFSIIYIPEKIPQKQEPFDSVKNRIKEIIEKEKVHQYVENKLEDIHDELNKEKDIKNKALELGEKVISTDLLTQGEAIKDLDEMGHISRKFFELKKNEIEFPVEFMQGLAIVQLSTIKEPAIEKFESVSQKVKEKFIQARKMNLLKLEAQDIINKLTGIKNQERTTTYLKNQNLSSDTFTYQRGNKLSHLPLKSGLDNIIFSANENQYLNPIEYDNEVVILKLKNKHVSVKEDFRMDKTSFYNSKINELKNIYFSSFVSHKRSDYKIHFNQELFEKIKDHVISRF